jgi:hypothetical protein
MLYELEKTLIGSGNRYHLCQPVLNLKPYGAGGGQKRFL